MIGLDTPNQLHRFPKNSKWEAYRTTVLCGLLPRKGATECANLRNRPICVRYLKQRAFERPALVPWLAFQAACCALKVASPAICLFR